MTVLLFLGTLLGCTALGMPIAFALLACGVTMMTYLGIFEAQLIAQKAVDGADNFILMAIPFFMLAGEIMNAGGLSRRIVAMAMCLVGHIPGGLGYVVVFASVVMASLSGSALADTSALGAILLPMMAAAGYNQPRSAGLIACGGCIGVIIPPSIPFVVFGVTAGVSITKLFMAGIVPGILWGVALIIAWKLVIRTDKLVGEPRPPMREVVRIFAEGIWAMALPFIIIFGLKFGIVTPTEAAVTAAVYAMFVGMFVYRELTFAALYRCMLGAGKATAVVLFLVAGAMVAAWLVTVADLPGKLITLLEPLIDRPTLFMLTIVMICMIIGTSMDMIPTILILAPVLMPVVKLAGIDPVYFGVIFVMVNTIGLITPPVGTVLTAICGIGRLKMDEVAVGMWPFILAQVIVVILLVLFPDIVIVPAKFFASR